MQITTILPVSRLKYLDRVLESLKNQTHKPTALIVVFDGSDEDYIKVRNRIAAEPGYEAICLKSPNEGPADSIHERRKNISKIHNQIRETINRAGWVFSIEDDGILPPDALEKLIYVAKNEADAGIITGVELGRWGVPYVGAWEVDDPFDPQMVTSKESRAGVDLVEEIDACGLYCALIRADIYKDFVFQSVNGLGPDVNLGLHSRQHGYTNYIHWGVPVTHLTSSAGIEMEIPATDKAKIVALRKLRNNTWSQIKL